ncbi:transposase [Brevibacillus nitrificans]|uniref:Transposase n=1 Tax=Brevibacillus nitrificans TaxID=651560 RepID=A0A3M8D7M6_9BACL|nr:transposase [Brevibacillus nitrificans]
MKMLLIGYLYGISSERKLEEEVNGFDHIVKLWKNSWLSSR